MEALASFAVIHVDEMTLIWCIFVALFISIVLSDTLIGLGIVAVVLLVAVVIAGGSLLHSLGVPTDRIIRIDNPPQLPRHVHKEPYYR